MLHIILNSHLDPVWLWNRSQGEDAVLATARTTCDLLDEHPDIHITRGESWFYEVVEKYDPEVFRRMRRHVADGRLHVVGGWHVQPDCNLCSSFSYRLHAKVAGDYFRRKFGVKVRTGYNVDSFGHAATLPDFYAEAGIENYLFMRPDPQEKGDLPGEVFHWRSAAGNSLLAGRIPFAYCSAPDRLPGHVEKTLASADRKLGHALLFCGIGDHGGGPSRLEIDWILAHRDDDPSVEFRFSHPDAFFDAVRASASFRSLPVYEGELQHHAIGCYTAFSPIKREMRSVEDLAMRSLKRLPAAERTAVSKALLFSTFHDVAAGTSIKTAYRPVLDELACARHRLEEAEIERVRRLAVALPPHPKQRIAIVNLGNERYEGVAEFEPWIYDGLHPFPEHFRLEDGRGKPLPMQFLPPESIAGCKRVAFPASIPAGRHALVHLGDGAPESTAPAPLWKGACPTFSFAVLTDATDTWSHGSKGYAAKADAPSLAPVGDTVRTLDGALIVEDQQRHADADGNYADVAVRREFGLPGVRLRIRLVWRTPRRIVKLCIRPGFKVARRVDGIPGGTLERRLDGEEFPIFNTCRLEGPAGRSLATVSNTVFACDVQPSGLLRLTLLRTPFFAHHDPAQPPEATLAPVTDLGEHFFEIALLPDATPDDIRREAFRQTRPLRFGETTRGMVAAGGGK
ncbi:MAG: hypothetical protein ACOX9C_08760 [Kiritimatiellia bacterium]